MKKILCVIALIMLSGCTVNSQKPADAGFTDKAYTGYQQREGSEGAFNRLYPGADLKKYHHVSFFKPLQIQTEGIAFTEMEQAEVEAISQRLHQKLSLAFEDLLAPPGPGVLVVVPTLISGERKSNPKNALDFIPFRIVLNAGKRVYREANNQEVAQYTIAIALEGFDGKSGDKVLGVIDRKSTDKVVVEKDVTNAVDLDQILDQWADRMRRNWDKVRAR